MHAMHIWMYVCICIRMSMHACKYVYLYVSMYVAMFYAYMHTHMHTYMYVCIINVFDVYM